MATLQFKGKSAVWNHHLSVPYHTLEKDAKKSLKGMDAEENLIIEGDNLLVLKSLLPNYQGRIKCIYIDPPYNTGNEGWVYSDNVNSNEGVVYTNRQGDKRREKGVLVSAIFPTRNP